MLKNSPTAVLFFVYASKFAILAVNNLEQFLKSFFKHFL